jgi:hypothetical protein
MVILLRGIALVVVLRGNARLVTAQSKQEGKCATSSQAKFEEALVFGLTCASDWEEELED